MKVDVVKTIRYFLINASLYLTLAQSVFAQTATGSASKGGVGTGGALPNAGSTELTYLLFLGGLIVFVVGTLKLILSFKADRNY